MGGSRRPQSSPRTPSHGVSRSLPTSSPCQEWIYRRPNKTTGHLQSHPFTVVSTPSRGRCRHSMDHDKQTAHSQLTTTASSAEPDAIPFWSTLLRSRSHSERFNPSLKAKPSRAQLVISRPFAPLPTISSSPVEPTFISTTGKHSHLRTPSMTSTASTASTSSTSRLCTPTIPTLSYNPKRHQQKETNQLSLSSSQGRCARSGLDYTPLSSSCPPCKSILARSSSLSTRGSHTTSAASGCSLSKSVKFVDIPTVHYPNADHLDFDDPSKIGANQTNETQMGIDVEGMDLGYESHIDGPETKAEDMEAARDALCNVPTLDREHERAAALKRVSSIKHRPPSSENRSNCGLSEPNPRPAISGPYALGTHASPTDDRASPAPIIPPTRRTKDSPLPPLPVSSQVKNRLRSASSMESVKSTLSTGARSILGLGGLKNSTRAWFGRSFGPGIKINFGIGWSLT